MFTNILQAAGAWSRFSSPFAALRGAPPPESPPRYPRDRPPVSGQRAAAAIENGWTAAMAEPLLDVCFALFFKYGEATLPLLPDMLALHQV